MLQPHSAHTTADGAVRGAVCGAAAWCAAVRGAAVWGALCVAGAVWGAPLCVVGRCVCGGALCVRRGAPVMSWSVAACTLESFFVIARFSDLSLQP